MNNNENQPVLHAPLLIPDHNRENIEVNPPILPTISIEFDNILQNQLETQFYASVPRDHCVDPERCPECSQPSHFHMIKDIYVQLVYDFTSETTSVSVKIQILLFIIVIVNRYYYFFKHFPNFLSILHDRINEIETRMIGITSIWYISYINDIMKEFYDKFKDQFMNL